MRYNNSRRTIILPIDFEQLENWFWNEIESEQKSVKEILSIVLNNQNDFIKWPVERLLLWHGVERNQQKNHLYPDAIKLLAKERRITLDSRPNGPAIASFLFANGQRPKRGGSNNSWNIHHLYSGKFQYPNSNSEPLHAVKNKLHFTQSAGLVAVHPIIDALFDEIPAMSWYFRYLSFCKFNYDPMEVFSTVQIDKYGFAKGSFCTVIFEDKID